MTAKEKGGKEHLSQRAEMNFTLEIAFYFHLL